MTAGSAPDGRHIWLVRHGETEWSRLGRHTGRTDMPLTDAGREQARRLGARLAGETFELVLSSPLSRAAETARLAGFGDRVELLDDLQEWDYGAFEGRTAADIRAQIPGWTIWAGPWIGGEAVDDVGARADRVIARLRAPAQAAAPVQGAASNIAVFAHGHFLRVLAARWIGLPAAGGGRFELATATVSILGWERGSPTIELWNEASHLA